jgi:hypothetical protein
MQAQCIQVKNKDTKITRNLIHKASHTEKPQQTSNSNPYYKILPHLCDHPPHHKANKLLEGKYQIPTKYDMDKNQIPKHSQRHKIPAEQYQPKT